MLDITTKKSRQIKCFYCWKQHESNEDLSKKHVALIYIGTIRPDITYELLWDNTTRYAFLWAFKFSSPIKSTWKLYLKMERTVNKISKWKLRDSATRDDLTCKFISKAQNLNEFWMILFHCIAFHFKPLHVEIVENVFICSPLSQHFVQAVLV